MSDTNGNNNGAGLAGITAEQLVYQRGCEDGAAAAVQRIAFQLCCVTQTPLELKDRIAQGIVNLLNIKFGLPQTEAGLIKPQ